MFADCSEIKIKVHNKSRAFQKKSGYQEIKTKQTKHTNLIHESNGNKYLE